MTAKKISEKGRLIVSVDDYHPLNIRLGELFRRLGIPATFFIETMRREAQVQIRYLHEMGFEIGCHTMSHPADLKAVTAEECRAEIEISKNHIGNITGKPCETLAYPRGRFNDQVIEIAKKVGIKEARTTHVLKTKEPENPMRTPTTIHALDSRKEYAGRSWRQMADFYLDDVKKNGDFFHFWMHAAEIERFNQWESIEEFLKEAVS